MKQDRRTWLPGTLAWFERSPYQGAFRTLWGYSSLVCHTDLCPDLAITHATYAQPWVGLDELSVEVVLKASKIVDMRPVLPADLQVLDTVHDRTDLVVRDRWDGPYVGFETMGSDSAIEAGFLSACRYITPYFGTQVAYHRSQEGAAAMLQFVYGHRGHVGEFLPAGLATGVQHGKRVLYVFVRELVQRQQQWKLAHKGLFETVAGLMGVNRVQLVKAQVTRPYALGIGEDGLLTIDSCRVLTWNGQIVSQEEDWLEHEPAEIVRHMTCDGLDKPARDALMSLKEYRQATKSQDAPQGVVKARDYARLLIALYEQIGFGKAVAYLPMAVGLELPEPYSPAEILPAVERTRRLANAGSALLHTAGQFQFAMA